MTDLVSFREITARAQAAYLAVMREAPGGWTPPPTTMKDKNWGRVLREAWPEHETIYVSNPAGRYTEMRKWCSEKPCAYWCSANGNAWYFENRSIAVLFKLSFGGENQ